MPQLEELILESWRRQVRIVDNVAGLVTDETAGLKMGEEEFTCKQHLSHTHLVRRGWLNEIDAERAARVPDVRASTHSLDQIREALKESAKAVEEVTKENMGKGPLGPYDDAFYYMQHMLWHEGWHVGAIIQLLRVNGHEPTDEWDEANIWSMWRVEEPQPA
ncbi:MAG TPA: DinB family protein [Fimbriimonas sp.]|nr:DinB family protein [Fimbriimonas sp.]